KALLLPLFDERRCMHLERKGKLTYVREDPSQTDVSRDIRREAKGIYAEVPGEPYGRRSASSVTLLLRADGNAVTLLRGVNVLTVSLSMDTRALACDRPRRRLAVLNVYRCRFRGSRLSFRYRTSTYRSTRRKVGQRRLPLRVQTPTC